MSSKRSENPVLPKTIQESGIGYQSDRIVQRVAWHGGNVGLTPRKRLERLMRGVGELADGIKRKSKDKFTDGCPS